MSVTAELQPGDVIEVSIDGTDVTVEVLGVAGGLAVLYAPETDKARCVRLADLGAWRRFEPSP